MGGRRPRPWYQPDACTLGSAPETLGLAQGSLLGCSSYSAKQAWSSLGMSDCGIQVGFCPFKGKSYLAVAVGEGSLPGRAPSPETRRASGLRASQASLGYTAGCWVSEVTA